MEIAVKKSEPKVDPKTPESHPGYKAAAAKAKAGMEKMKFESEGQKKDYLRAVARNPNNIPGLPVFYPPLSMGVFSGFSGINVEEKMDMLPCGKVWSKATYGENGTNYKCQGCQCSGYSSDHLTVRK